METRRHNPHTHTYIHIYNQRPKIKHYRSTSASTQRAPASSASSRAGSGPSSSSRSTWVRVLIDMHVCMYGYGYGYGFSFIYFLLTNDQSNLKQASSTPPGAGARNRSAPYAAPNGGTYMYTYIYIYTRTPKYLHSHIPTKNTGRRGGRPPCLGPQDGVAGLLQHPPGAPPRRREGLRVRSYSCIRIYIHLTHMPCMHDGPSFVQLKHSFSHTQTTTTHSCVTMLLTHSPIQTPRMFAFQCISMDTHRLAFVDASRRANLGSSLSHSCNSNCYTEARFTYIYIICM
jgi:hypothetical protein